ncbi:cell division protein FtsL [Legionella londiniensis]|uniref:Cell division protein FtsL n=1 Tax=Legionella londiniensis TaxID=45068 RepID=A0A0W0VR86_9GAMM|nr:cell division protein FtsL [Legionella londiniensis]KTD22445.1 cell division transmembrane protein FtsL [Legionella londiniensis]STX92982.1 cell division transmembrane protein FtsL [Legionella londiniensis]
MNAAAKMIHQSNFFTGQFTDIRISRQFCLRVILALSVFFSALAVVYVTNLHRITFNQLQQAEERAHHLQLQWGQLLLEQASLASPARVQKLAIEKLGMRFTSGKQVINLRAQ